MAKKRQSRKTRDSDCCSINFVKYVLHIFNIIFFMSGVAVVAVAMWTILYKHQYESLLATSNYVIGTYALLVAGLLATIGGFLGCCGVWREQRIMILWYIFILLVVFLLEITVGGLAYLYESQIENELNSTLNRTFLDNYGFDDRKTLAIDQMQQEYQCCGAIRFEDWEYSEWLKSDGIDTLRPIEGRLVPDSCCISMTPKCGLRNHPSNIPYTGCIYEMIGQMRDHLNILGGVGTGLCLVQLFGIVLSCCLYVKLKDVVE